LKCFKCKENQGEIYTIHLKTTDEPLALARLNGNMEYYGYSICDVCVKTTTYNEVLENIKINYG
jgi:hypothetical protein